MKSTITRRRTIQGIAAIGAIGVAGNAIVSTSEGVGGVQEDQAALRVAHASPDVPNVEVRLDESGTDGTGTETDDIGTETDIVGTETGTPTGTEDGGDGPLIEDLGFSEVSEYQEVDPGTYQLQVVATEETGLLEEIFGGGDDQGQVVYDEEVDLEGGTTYTAVAFGELTQSDGTGGGETPGGEDETPNGETPTDSEGTPVGETPSDGGEVLVEQLAYGEYESFETEAGDYTLEFRESAGSGVGATDGTEQGFRVEIIEDDLSAPGEGTSAGDGTETPMDEGTPAGEETPTDGGTPGAGGTPDGAELSRMLVFHAVPDVDALTVVSVEDEGGGGIFGSGGDSEDTETQTETGTQTTETGDGTAVETTAQGGSGDGEESSGVAEADVSLDGGTVYSGFAMGYFDPEAAAGGEETPTAETPAGEGTVTDDGDGVPTETPDGTPTGTADGTPTGTDGGVTEDGVAEEFQFVTVETATDGERADGGTGGGILPDASAPPESSD